MSQSAATEAVRKFLSGNSEQAFLVSEVVAAVRSPSLAEAEVVSAMEELSDKGEMVSRLFPVNDPHLAFTSLRFVAAVGADGNPRQAELRAEKAFQGWLREWLSSHRCC